MKRKEIVFWLLGPGLVLMGFGFEYSQRPAKQIGFVIALIGVTSLLLTLFPSGTQGRIYNKAKAIGGGIAVATLIFAFIGEVATRIYFWEGESFSSRSGAIARRFERDFVTNKYDGPSRGPEVLNDGPHKTTRILVQGDSITWGQGVRNEETLYTARLLMMLQQTKREVDMAVLAYPGREIDGHIEQLRKWGPRLQPDLLIYQWFVNDIELEKKRRPSRSHFRPWRKPFFHAALMEHSFFWFLIDQGLNRALPSPPESYDDYLRTQYSQGTQGWSLFEANFIKWVHQARSLTSNIVVFLYPMLTSQRGQSATISPEIATIHSQMTMLCEKLGVLCVDMTPWFESESKSGKSMKASRFDAHPSTEVHAMMARNMHVVLTRDILGPEPADQHR